ncbi:MAG: PQQ-binding-like beta-propeller repeat protein [Anaerolineae bacterium]|nr:PQQ-binding-like beta-propeller repeat protein [Anaerolineae bacterium]
MTNLDTRRITTDERPVASQPEGTLPIGTILQERYEILGVQGVGGMGAVYRARDLRFAAVTKIVAVKEMNNTAPDPRLRRISIQNFEREANILASLSHPAIPKIFDYFSERHRSYLILEFIDGRTLEEVADERHRPHNPEEVVDWGLQICDVLVYLHSHQPPVVFRDVKPGNLMIRADGGIMVIDFGIAKVFEHGQRGTMIGTEGYSPPEQYRGVAEPRGDVYALAATMHHLLTGRDPRLEPPFTFHERPIRTLNPAVPEALEAVIMKALSYDLQERYGSANEMALALSTALPVGRRPTGTLGTTSMSPLPQEVAPQWVFKCEDEVRSSPRIADGVVYIGSYDHNLYALDAQKGSFVWKFPTEGGIASTPCLYEDMIIIGSEDGHVYALSRRLGDKLWTLETGACVRSSSHAAFGHGFVGSDDGHLYAFNVRTGRTVWKFQSAAPIRSTPLLIGEILYVGSDDGYVYALELRSGLVKWKHDTHRRVTSSPAESDGLIVIGSADGHVYALNAGSGWPVWRARTRAAVLSSPAIADGVVYIGSADGHLYAFDASNGREIWRYDTGGPVTSSPAVTGGRVYIGSNSGGVYAVETRRGQEVWQYQTGAPVPSSPCVFEGVVYIGSVDNHVYALPA